MEKQLSKFDRIVKRAMVRAHKYPHQLTREERELLKLVIELADSIPEKGEQDE